MKNSIPSSKFSNFQSVAAVVDKFSLVDFNDLSKVKSYSNTFQIETLCLDVEEDRLRSKSSDILRSVSESEDKPFAPELSDLCRIHWLTIKRKSLSVLELGSGFSTVIVSEALRLLSSFHFEWVKNNLRYVKPFHIHAVEEEQRFLDITSKRLTPQLHRHATLHRSSVELVEFNGHIATLYSKLPNICPDLIYVDGPSQFATTQEVRGFSFGNPERMPMSADILTFEFFLQPGTLVLVDGRTANARFLRANLKRNWAYIHDEEGDIHLFELQERPLGKFNRKQLEFCISNTWLLPSPQVGDV